MPSSLPALSVKKKDRSVLEKWVRATTTPGGLETCGPFTWTKGPNKLKRIIELTQQYQDRYVRN